jgi:hypothetical protein
VVVVVVVVVATPAFTPPMSARERMTNVLIWNMVLRDA